LLPIFVKVARMVDALGVPAKEESEQSSLRGICYIIPEMPTLVDPHGDHGLES
jgi:hypothetical protein